ncbi:MAG: twin-arginine translocase TatA/TatE family subunit [Nitrospinota bacterium]|nr:twin-arginine translocase TatA/TatE family subunit [Nitrospinota bacterium]
MFNFGIWELLIILVIIVLLFGVKRIPQLGTSLGEGIKNFTKSFKSEDANSEKKEPLESSDNSKNNTT